MVVQELNKEKIRDELLRLKNELGFNSVAIVLMHSYSYDTHELQVAEIARSIGIAQVSLSSEIMKRVKLVNRGQTCCVDAYLNPHSIFYELHKFYSPQVSSSIQSWL